MKRSFWLPLSITLPIVAIILATQASHNRKLAEQLAEREASAAAPRESRTERARDPGGPGALSLDEMMAKFRSMAVYDDRTGLLRRIAERDPGRVFEMLPSLERLVIQGSCLQCHGETPPKQGSCERSVSRIDSMLMEEGWKMADYIFGQDPEMGLRAFAEMRKRDFSKSNALGNYALSGSIPLDDEQVPRMAAAIENPEFAAIRSNIIEITLNDALFEGGVAAMAERLKALPLSGEDLKRYMEGVIHDGSGSSSLTKIDILFTEPTETLQWVAKVGSESDQRQMIPDMVLNWAKRDANAAFKWVGKQAPSPLRDANIARLVTKGPNLDQGSAESWAREIRDQDLRERTLQEVLKAGR
jgi:hypothetical protein